MITINDVNVSNNPLPIPPEILNIGKQKEILNYLLQLYRTNFRPLHEAKVLLIGQGSVGKTSLKKQLIHSKFDKNESQTHGLKVEYWPIKINENKIRLNV